MNVSLASTFSLQTNYWNVDPTFETVNKVLWCDLSNETSSAVLLNGRTFSSEFKVLGNTLKAGRNGYRTVFHSFLGDDSWLSKRQYRLACDIARCRIHRCWEYVSLSETDCLLCSKRFLFIGYLALLVPLHQRRYIPMFTKNNWSQHLLYSWWTQSRVTRDFVVLARKPTRA